MSYYRPDAIAYLTGQLSSAPRPQAISPVNGGGKFTPEGAVLPFAGNTFIFHIDKTSDAFAALEEMQARVKASAVARHFAFLPVSSFHMTLFQGISGPNAADERWPQGVDRSASRDAVSHILAQRLADVRAPASHSVKSVNLFCARSLTVTGADADQEASLREMRIRLRDATGLYPDHFERYTFHITLAYLLEWLDEDTARKVVDLSNEVYADFAARLSEIRLGLPEFCNFETMHHFEPIGHIGPSGFVLHNSLNRNRFKVKIMQQI